jgi:hypothetical protein
MFSSAAGLKNQGAHLRQLCFPTSGSCPVLQSWVIVMICVIRNAVVITVVMSGSAQWEEGGESPKLNSTSFGQIVRKLIGGLAPQASSLFRVPVCVDSPILPRVLAITTGIISTVCRQHLCCTSRGLTKYCYSTARSSTSRSPSAAKHGPSLRTTLNWHRSRAASVSEPSSYLPGPAAGQGGIVGDTFLKNVYSVFRANPASVGFAHRARSHETACRRPRSGLRA